MVLTHHTVAPINFFTIFATVRDQTKYIDFKSLSITYLIENHLLSKSLVKKVLLFAATVAMAASMNAESLASSESYIHEVGGDGYFLASGFSWGTLAVLKEQPRAFVIGENGDGTYDITSALGNFKPENGEMYMDGADKTATSLEDAGEGNYYIKIDGKYLAKNELRNGSPDCWDFTNPHADKAPCWSLKFVDTKDEAVVFEILTKDDMVARLDAASETNPVNATFYLKAHNTDVNDPENVTAWVYTQNGTKVDTPIAEGSWGSGMDQWHNKSVYIWCHHDDVESTDVLSQEVEGLKPGYYMATYRVVNQALTPFEVTLNGTKGTSFDVEGDDLWHGSIAERFADNPQSVKFTVGEDGKFSFKMTKTCEAGKQSRFGFKNITLAYLGSTPTSVAETIANDNAPVEYYNLQGVRVANPSKGLFIKKQGNKVTKVIR